MLGPAGVCSAITLCRNGRMIALTVPYGPPDRLVCGHRMGEAFPMTMHGPYSYRVEEGDLAAAGRHYYQRRVFQRPMRYLLFAVLVLAVVLVFLDLFEDGALKLSTLIVVGLGIPLIWLIPYLIAPRVMRRQFRQSAALRDEHEMIFDGESITFTNQRGHARIPFHELYAWSQTDRMILLHQTEAFFNPVPKQAMGEDYRHLVAALDAAGVKRF